MLADDVEKIVLKNSICENNEAYIGGFSHLNLNDNIVIENS